MCDDITAFIYRYCIQIRCRQAFGVYIIFLEVTSSKYSYISTSINQIQIMINQWELII